MNWKNPVSLLGKRSGYILMNNHRLASIKVIRDWGDRLNIFSRLIPLGCSPRNADKASFAESNLSSIAGSIIFSNQLANSGEIETRSRNFIFCFCLGKSDGNFWVNRKSSVVPNPYKSVDNTAFPLNCSGAM